MIDNNITYNKPISLDKNFMYQYNILYSYVNMMQIDRAPKRITYPENFKNMIGYFKPHDGFEGDIFVRKFPTNNVEYTMNNTAYTLKIY
jgi:hypothetical protein